MIKKIDIVKGVAFVIPLNELRQTPGVLFHDLPGELVTEVDAIDRVEHGTGAYSPVAQNLPDVRAWYMHPHQEDNLLVLRGSRHIELYTTEHGKIERFEATPHYVKHEGITVAEGPTILGWGTHTFHRVQSPNGSISMNFARHFEGFNIDDNFNIYTLDEKSGKFEVLREGHLDQPMRDFGE